MRTGNALTSLFIEASIAMARHGSPIAQISSNALHNAAYQPIVKPPYTVAQCQQLKHAYEQACSSLNSLVKNLEPYIHWTDSGSGSKPKAVQDRLAYVELVGPTGMVLNNAFRAGLFFQSKNTRYPDHRHAAEELYLVISGRALWSNETDHASRHVLAGEFVHHASWETHAMYTGEQPMLAMWCWTGDIGFDQYEMV